ncbi:MAG: hypothetical protein HQK62_00835 [Desulfamplus sp.]|nr:hypothetical protein [Desulfamplus sp.]
MSVQVIIYSSDRIRGGILREILRRNKTETLLLDNIMDVKSAISSHKPDIAIFDTSNSLKNEINSLKHLSSSIEECFVMILGDALIINVFHDGNLWNKLFLTDPLDPEIIISKSREILSRIQENRATVKSSDHDSTTAPVIRNIENMEEKPSVADEDIDLVDHNLDIEHLESDLRQYLKLD